MKCTEMLTSPSTLKTNMKYLRKDSRQSKLKC